MVGDIFVKRGLLQSPTEWAERNRALSATLSELIRRYARMKTWRGLDVGCQRGLLTDMLQTPADFRWWGVDPAIKEPRLSAKGVELLPGCAHQISFPASHFDCVVLANVYEHIAPEQRAASLAEIHRVLVKGGILVGQLPNPYFPIEAHSRLPFMGYLPHQVQQVYWRLSPVSWKLDFYVVTIKDLKRRAWALNFETVVIRRFNYPVEALPGPTQGIARALAPLIQMIPWSWQFVFRKI